MNRSQPGAFRKRMPCEPIRVLFLIDQLCGVGGAERALLKIVRHLPRERFVPLVATFRFAPAFPARDELAAPLHVLPLRRTYDFDAFRAAYALRRLIRNSNVRIVHTFFETADLWGGAVAKLSGCRVLISSRRDMGIQRSWKHGLAYRILGRMFNQVHTVSEEVRQFTIRRDCLPPQRVITVYNGVDITPSAAPAGHDALCCRLGVPASSRIVITVANIRPVKGIELVLRAARLASESRRNVIFLIVGDAPDPGYLREMQDLVQSLQVASCVRFWGPERDVGSLLKAADVFLLLSHSEGFSNALVEAMACGLPCVASDVGGNREAVQSGETGFVTPPGDYTVAAARIGELLDCPEERRRMGAAARERVQRQFTTAAMIQRITASYEALLQ